MHMQSSQWTRSQGWREIKTDAVVLDSRVGPAATSEALLNPSARVPGATQELLAALEAKYEQLQEAVKKKTKDASEMEQLFSDCCQRTYEMSGACLPQPRHVGETYGESNPPAALQPTGFTPGPAAHRTLSEANREAC